MYPTTGTDYTAAGAANKDDETYVEEIDEATEVRGKG